ncbi:hypothetical protein PS467_22240 [Streptomyces luomodiensis]|uniref:DAGKc domain-containing protein n=1 Tax=Streptomyces luomodiensis TaxID=3026192 RepID=A0ABY9UZX0_9ACTN|nr:hypothetical protein [Streptomyces sp. SCA4-21]WNE97856.1 hypothetical protein PS467_22240 [Streptomyces sp. SCA4-21]
MSAPDPRPPAPDTVRERPLLIVIDPHARRTDGESVRIAKDVLCAGAPAKICLPDGPEEVERALARRGTRRPVVVGDDRALLRIVELLHRRRELADATLSVVPVGGSATIALAHSLGVPTDTVTAARTVLDGVARPRDLLVDESGGVVLGGLRIPSGLTPYSAHGTPADGCGTTAGPAGPDGTAGPGGPGGTGGTGGHGQDPHGGAARGRDCHCDPCAPCDHDHDHDGRHDRHDHPDRDGKDGGGPPGHAPRGGAPEGDGHRPWWTPAARTARTALTLLSLPMIGLAGGARRPAHPPPQRLRIEADGVLLTDLDRPVERVSVSTAAPGGGLAEVVVHPHAADGPLRTRARAVTVSGQDFHYHADALVRGPVRSRTWTVLAEAWSLMLPHGP